MEAIFKKLNLKSQVCLLFLNGPDTFVPLCESLSDSLDVSFSKGGQGNWEFALAFATKLEEVESLAENVIPRLEGDAVFWIAYPKASSRKYRCEFNRDTCWASIGARGWEPVRQVAIDEDWSALRFRKVEYISKLTRSEAMMLSEEGKQRLAKK